MKNKKLGEISVSSNLILNIFLIILCTLILLPVVLMVMASITDEATLISNGYSFFPDKFSLKAYEFFFSEKQTYSSIFVSVAATALGTAVSVYIMSSLAYVLFRKEFKFGKQLAFFVFFTMLFNGGLVPSYMVNTNLLNLQDTIWALILPHAVNGFYVIVLRTFYSTSIPEELIDSSKIDGASELRVYFTIVMPLAMAGIATVSFFMAVYYWNDWFMALLYINDDKLVPLQSLLMKIEQNLTALTSGGEVTGMNVVASGSVPAESSRMALAVIILVPIFILYPFTQKYFTKGLTVGAVKG